MYKISGLILLCNKLNKFFGFEENPKWSKLCRASQTNDNQLDDSPGHCMRVGGLALVTESLLVFLQYAIKVLFFKKNVRSWRISTFSFALLHEDTTVHDGCQPLCDSTRVHVVPTLSTSKKGERKRGERLLVKVHRPNNKIRKGFLSMAYSYQSERLPLLQRSSHANRGLSSPNSLSNRVDSERELRREWVRVRRRRRVNG